MFYILETTSTGSGLDIYFDLAMGRKVTLVTNSMEKYSKDINRHKLRAIRHISHQDFETSLDAQGNRIWV